MFAARSAASCAHRSLAGVVVVFLTSVLVALTLLAAMMFCKGRTVVRAADHGAIQSKATPSSHGDAWIDRTITAFARPTAAFALFALTLAIGCVYDSAHQCPDGFSLGPGGFCVCDPGSVPDPGGSATCVACPAHELATDQGTCVCSAGYTRATAGAACTADGLGTACDSASAPCASTTYSACHATMGSAGYCTSTGCASDNDCPDTYACRADTAMATYCQRPPVGEGKSCAADSDCAGTQATYCESNTLKQCLVQGCAVGAMDCSRGHTCCDLTKLGLAKTICLPVAQCPGS